MAGVDEHEAPGVRRLRLGAPGVVPYETALAWQEALVAEVQAGADDAALLLEHPAVYTLGRGADPSHLRAAAGGAIPVVRVGRGGQVTYHGPGQLVCYPILALRRHRADVRWYVRTLEQIVIDTLGDCGIVANRREGYPGVWIGERRKIASIGVGIKRWVTWHGLALNVGPDLSGFLPITPCGIADATMTSVAREGGPSSIAAVLPLLQARVIAAFGYDEVARLAGPPDAGAVETAVTE